MNIFNFPKESTTSTKLPAKYCLPVQTFQKDLATKAWLNYDTKTPEKQPDHLVMLKNMHNNITNTMFDGTQGTVPGESFMQQRMLKNLKAEIDKMCE